MTEKAIYQPWREAEFSADVNVQAMTFMQRWMYRTLCQKAFICSTRPFPPDDDSILWKLSGCSSRAMWDQHKTPVRDMFSPRVIDGVKVLFHKCLDYDWTKIRSVRAAKSESAKIRWDQERRKMHTHADAVRMYADECKEVKVSEVKGSKSKSKDRATKNEWPHDFTLTKELRAYGIEHGVNADVEFPIFESHHRSKRNKFSSWPRAWYTWVLRAEKSNPRRRDYAAERENSRADKIAREDQEILANLQIVRGVRSH